MKKIYLLPILLFYILFLSIQTYSYNMHPPKLTIVIVVDQLAHHYINKLQSRFKYGLKYLFNNGVVYTNAHFPHGQPGTAVGHAGLNTGTYAKDHGFISNAWYNPAGNKISCDDDSSLEASVIIPNEENMVYDYGKSSHFLMVDGISDQCVLQSTPNSPFRSFSISGKSRSAIATASKLGKAIWFDSDSGLFTSSKSYFKELPDWLKNFNNINNVNDLGSITWQRMYPKSPYAYQFFNIHNYDYARKSHTMLNRPLPVPDLEHEKNYYHLFERTPQANKQIFDLSQVCIKNNVSRKTKDRLLLWVCLSPLDKLAHLYGPDSIEAIDMIYHLDKQLQKFIRFALRTVGKHQVVFALTADHGVPPIPELVHDQGLSLGHRIDPADFALSLNEQLEKTYDIPNIVKILSGQELILNHSVMSEIDSEDHKQIIVDVKNSALQNPFVHNAWTFDELTTMPTHSNTILDNIKNQLFRGRSGQVIIQPYTYALFTNERKGTSHSRLPYEYNTHVPLILFHPGKFERKYVRQRVTTLQLANTLAELLNIPKPSASTAEVLPELFDPEYQ
jgi:predicted AlkP superfamily pyrophosphatase or phosphodiesterase